jgi:hypothetical protein
MLTSLYESADISSIESAGLYSRPQYFPKGRTERMHHRSNRLTMLFIGLAAAAGAGIALVTAPHSGKQMRRTLRRKYEGARDAVEDLGNRASDWVDKGSELADRAKRKIA